MSVIRLSMAVFALAVLCLALPTAAGAQQTGKVPTIGYLVAGPRDCKLMPRDEALYQGLRELGHVPGQNIRMDRRCYLTADEARKLLSGFVDSRVDVIIVGAPEPARAARAATTDIPIVCVSCGDPLANGLAASLARPGGNVTGLASQSVELLGKRIELLKEAVPGIARVAALVNPNNPGTPATLNALDTVGRASGIAIQRVEYRTLDDLDRAFRSAATGGARAVLVQDDPAAFAARRQIAELAVRYRLAAATGIPDTADAGALMAYGPNRVDSYRRAAGFVDKILKGARPGDIPFEQPTKYELVVNLKTARALGVTIAPSLLLRADRVIE